MNTAAMVISEKRRHPERFCASSTCLWRVKHQHAVDTPCPRHPAELYVHEFSVTLVARIAAPTAADAKEAIADVVARVAHVSRFEIGAEEVAR